MSHTKRIRITKDQNNHNMNRVHFKTPTEKVLHQKDYLSIICTFLTILELFASIPLISTFHIDYLKNNNESSPMFKQLFNNQFGNILQLLKINLPTKNKLNSENNHNSNNNIG